MNRIISSYFFHFLVISFLLLAESAFAGGIKGKIKDDKSGEMIVGATVYLKQTNISAFTDLDGSYHLKNVPSGTYTLIASFIGYVAKEKVITVSDKDLRVDFNITENTTVLDEVTVSTTAEAGSDVQSRKMEQNSESVVSMLSAKTIEMMPDINVGSISQRVSGVSIVRNGSGDGQYAIIRGMDARYNYTTINGLKIPSPDNKNRYVPLDIFPADLLERMEVVKALTPSMEGDAIGGAMNLQMKSAPQSRQISVTMSGGYSEVISKNPFTIFKTNNINYKSPFDINGTKYQSQVSDYSLDRLRYHQVKVPVSSTYGLVLGDRFLKKKLGLIVAGSFQNLYRSHNGIFYNIAGQPNPGNIVSNNGIDRRYYSSLQQRAGIHMNLDYKIGLHTTLNFYNVFVQLSEALHRQVDEIRTTEVGEYTNHDRSIYQRQRVNSSTFKVEHHFLPTMKLSLTGNYSLADNRIPDQVELAVKERVDKNTMTGQILEPGYYINSMTHRWYRNKDVDKGLYASYIYSITPWFEVNVGGLTKSKQKDNYYTENTLSTFGSNSIGQPYYGLDNVVFEFKPISNAYNDSTDGKNYVATEKINAAYIQTKFLFFKQVQILGGLRVETTAQSYTSALSASVPGKSGTIGYKDYLPSVHGKWALNKKSNLRASYFKGISRPALYEFIPASNIGDYYTEIGNYNLKHTKSSNYDVRFEHFMSGDEQLLIGAFYKKIINPIEYSFQQIFNNSYFYAPGNFGTATNYGLEFVFSKYYKKFGLSGNYTFTESSITTPKRTVELSGIPGTVNVTRPLQGQSKHIANVALLYKNKKAGLDLRISWVYTGERINIVSAYYGLDYWQRPMQQIDFSGEQKIGKHLSVFVKATNLLNAQTIVEIRSPLPAYFVGNPEQNDPNRVLVSRDQFGRTYYAGLRLKL